MKVVVLNGRLIGSNDTRQSIETSVTAHIHVHIPIPLFSPFCSSKTPPPPPTKATPQNAKNKHPPSTRRHNHHHPPTRPHACTHTRPHNGHTTTNTQAQYWTYLADGALHTQPHAPLYINTHTHTFPTPVPDHYPMRVSYEKGTSYLADGALHVPPNGAAGVVQELHAHL